PAVDVVSDFLVPLRFRLEQDAAQIVARAGSLAPYRKKDNEHITTSLLLFALVEFGGRENDRELETVVEPFLTTLRRWDGYTGARESYFTANIKTIRLERDLPTVSALSANVERLLREACEIAKIMRFNILSSGALAGA